MAKKFIKTVYITKQQGAGAKKLEKIDLYETDCFVIYEVTTIENRIHIGREKKDTDWFNKYSWVKKFLDPEFKFDKTLVDEFKKQSKEYREKAVNDLNISRAKNKVLDDLFKLKIEFTLGVDNFKGDWVELSKKTEKKFKEIIDDFKKFLEE